MKNLANILLCLLTLLALCSCGREAEIIDAPKSYNQQVVGLQAFNAFAGKMETQTRAITLLFYPRPEHIVDFSYSVDDLSKPSWEMVLATLPYADKVVSDYPASMDKDVKVQKMVAAIQSVGRSRDNAWREMAPLDVKMKEINAKKVLIQEEISETEPDVKWRDFTCYYAKRPRRGQKYQCRPKKDDEFKRRKAPRGCDDLLELEFTYDNPEDQAAFDEVYVSCEKAAPRLAELDSELKALNEDFDELYEKFEPLERIRKSGEAVVLDILQTAERYTKEEGFPQVYVATGSSQEKPNNQDIISEVKIDFQKIMQMRDREAQLVKLMSDTRLNSYEFNDLKKEHTAVVRYLENGFLEKFSLWLEFGLNYSGGTRSQEYSIENGGIQDFKLVWSGVNPAFHFKIVNKDFWIECELDVTNDDPAMGYRAVGEVFAHYPDGSITRGGMKLEFNMLQN